MQDAAGGEMVDKKNNSVAKKTENWLESKIGVRWIYGIAGFITIAAIFIGLQFSTRAICCGDYDGYYHIRWSQLLWENFSQGKWLPEFVWLPLTKLSPEVYADHHFLFHLLQIPFLWFFEPIMAAKVGAVVFATLAVFSCYWLILRYDIDYPIVWLLALLTCANPFYFRMNMAKAPPLSIIFTVLGIWLLFERRYVWLLPLTFFFTWAYSLYPMLIIASVIWAAIIFWNDNRLEWRPVVYSVGGAVAGNIINPYFPTNLYLFAEHLATKIKVKDFDVPVGGEWYPYDSWQLLGLCAVAMLAMVLGYILYQPNENRLEEKSTFLLAFATFLMVWTFQSKRFAEYFPPMAILFAAFAFDAYKNRRKSDAIELPEEFRRDLSPFLDKEVVTEKQEKNEFWQTAYVSLICIMLFVYMFLTLRGFEIPGRNLAYKGLAKELAENEPPEKFDRMMAWANENIPEFDKDGKRTRLFNTDWDDFPKLFFLDTKHAYVTGLDPNYLYSVSPDNYRTFEDITNGKIDDVATPMRDILGATYAVSDHNHDDFYVKAIDSGWFDKVYEDDEGYILKMRDKQGEPPAEKDEKPSDAPEEVEENAETEENTNQ